MTNLSIENEIAILNKYRLNPTELFVLRLILLAQDDEENSSLYDYLALPEDCKGNFRETLISLQNKGIILKSYKIPESGTTIESIYEIPINKNSIKSFYKAAFVLGNELYEHYPQFGTINGRSFPLRSVAKKFNSLEDAFRIYGKSINWNTETHKHILELIDWAKDRDVLNMTLASFIVNHSWRDLEAMKEGNADNLRIDSFIDI